jgi:DNA polymerase III delta prime subunit
MQKKAKDIKDKNFIKALVKHNGVVSKAYKELNPHVTDGSARVLGSRQLTKVSTASIIDMLSDMKYSPKEILGKMMELAENSRNEGIKLKVFQSLAKYSGFEKEDKTTSELDVLDETILELAKKHLAKELQEHNKD